MNTKRFAGMLIILIGVMISLSKLAITGAVIGVEKSSLIGVIGAIIVLVGLLVLMSSRKI